MRRLVKGSAGENGCHPFLRLNSADVRREVYRAREAAKPATVLERASSMATRSARSVFAFGLS